MSLNSSRGDRNESAPPRDRNIVASSAMNGGRAGHVRNTSDSDLPGPIPPQVPPHGEGLYSMSPAPGRGPNTTHPYVNDLAATPERISSDEETVATPVRDFDGMRRMQTPEPVSQPPTFSHAPGDKPNNRPYHSPEMRRANSRLSLNTLKQLEKAGGVNVGQDAWGPDSERSSDEHKDASRQNPDLGGPPLVHLHVNDTGMPANIGSREVLMNNAPRSPGLPPDMDSTSQRSRSPFNPATDSQPDLGGPNPNYRPKTPTSRPGTATGNRPPGPPPHGPPQGNHHGGFRGPPTGPLPGPPGMPPPGRGRGRPPPNMPHSGRGYSPNGPPGMYQPGPPGPGGRGRPKTPPANRAGPQPALNTSPPIHRKPLPARSDSLQQRQGREAATPVAESASTGNFTGNRIDAAGFGQVRTHDMSQPPQPGIRRINTMESQSSSRYDDGASSSSPDYSSSRPSTETAASVERPRAGVLRTTGAAEESGTRDLNFDIPGIDFGPTLNYAVAPRSMTSSGGVTQSSMSPPPRSHSPATTFSHRPVISDSAHSRKDSEENVRRSVIWQPGSAFAGSPGSSGPVLSPEEFVQQRAATAATPIYAHQRHSSGITLSGYRAGTPTPPLGRGQDHDYIGTAHSRNSSQDLLQRPNSRGAGDILQRPASRGAGDMLQRPNSRGAGDLLQRPGSRGAAEVSQRPKSRELLQRPGSRGAGAVLGGQQGQGESSLSAREQEHVARVTGSPLINLAGNKNTQPAGGGLVGAIHARERDKEHMKQGWASQAAQTAIQRQQQQQVYQQYQPPTASPSLPPPAGMYANMGRGMGMGPQSPRQHGFGMQDAHWAPGPSGFRSPTPGSMDPRFMASQAQFASSPPFPGGPHGGPGAAHGQNPHPYHGQAF
jgi:CCR4-NOT transcriptional complex subunit CAF120